MTERGVPAIPVSRFVGVTLALTALGILVLGSDRAQGSHIDCGDTITADTTLDSDLLGCPNNGIVIGADGVTLDLNGHLIDGDGALDPSCDASTEFCDTGVVSEGHSRVTVMDGSIRQFGGGITLFSVRRNRLKGISTTGNHFIGIQLFDATRSVVRGSSGKGPDEEIGLGLFSSRQTRIVHNSFRNTTFDGIVIAGGSRNVVARNRVHGAGHDGVTVEAEAKHLLLRRNRASRSGDDGFAVKGSTTTLTENHARRNGDLGIKAVRGVRDGGGNTAHGNGDPRQCTNVVCS